MLLPQPADAIECWEALRTEVRGSVLQIRSIRPFLRADRAVIDHRPADTRRLCGSALRPADQLFGSAFPGLYSPEVTSSVVGLPCFEFAAAGGSNGSSCTVPSVIRVVLMPVSGSKWIDRTAASRVSCVGFGLAPTFALFGV